VGDKQRKEVDMPRWVFTAVGAAVSAFLLLGLILNLASGTTGSGLVLLLYVAVAAAPVAGGLWLDKRRRTTPTP
jgi:hypothetical protein